MVEIFYLDFGGEVFLLDCLSKVVAKKHNERRQDAFKLFRSYNWNNYTGIITPLSILSPIAIYHIVTAVYSRGYKWTLKEDAPINEEKKRKRGEHEKPRHAKNKPIDELIEEEKQQWIKLKANKRPHGNEDLEEEYEIYYQLIVY